MKLLVLVLVILFGFQFSDAYAQAKEIPSKSVTHPQKLGKPITAKVNGMVCAFCAQGIKKRFMALDVVQSVQVSLEKKTVVIELKPNDSLSDQTIEKTIKEAGYSIIRIER